MNKKGMEMTLVYLILAVTVLLIMIFIIMSQREQGVKLIELFPFL